MRTGRRTALAAETHPAHWRARGDADGNTLISSDWAGTVLVWDLTYYNDRIRRELEYRITRTAEPYCASHLGYWPTANFNHGGSIDSQDFFDFLAAFFAGMPDIHGYEYVKKRACNLTRSSRL